VVDAARAAAITNDLSDTVALRTTSANRARDYYEGRQRLKFASKSFSDYFADRYRDFADNWCLPVADAPTERLVPIGIRPGQAGDGQTPRADADLWRVWLANDADAGVGLALLDAIIARRSYALVWGNDTDPDTPEITFESATEAIVGYEPGSRTRRAAGLKTWCDDTLEYATLFLPAEVWRFDRPRTRLDQTKLLDRFGNPLRDSLLPGGWQLRELAHEPNPKPNPMGEVPLVELPNRPVLSGEPLSDIAGVMAMQDAVNLLWSLLFTAADYASFPQRIVIGAERPTTPILDATGQVIGKRPVPLEKFAIDKVLWLTDPAVKIEEWSAANLDQYTQIIETAIGHIAAQTRTPQHYLIGKMANLSADALKAAETGLVMRTKEKQLYQGKALREVFRLVAVAQHQPAKAKALRSGTVLWRDAESRSEAQLVDALLKLSQLGFPFEWLCERYGLDPAEITRVLAMRATELDRVLAGDPAALTGPKPPLPADLPPELVAALP